MDFPEDILESFRRKRRHSTSQTRDFCPVRGVQKSYFLHTVFARIANLQQEKPCCARTSKKKFQPNQNSAPLAGIQGVSFSCREKQTNCKSP